MMIIKQDKNAKKKSSISIGRAAPSSPIYLSPRKAPAKRPPVLNPATDKVRLDDRLRAGFPGMKPGLVTDIRALMLARTPMPAGGKMLQRVDPANQGNYRTPEMQPQVIDMVNFPMQQLESAGGEQLQGSNARMKLYRPYFPKRRL